MCAKHTAGPPHYARSHTVTSDPLPRALAEREFMTVRSSQDVEKISKAWRVAGGTFYKVELRCSELSCGRSNPQRATPKADNVAPSARGRRQLVCDMQHAFSCKVWPSALPPELRLRTPLPPQSRHAPVRMYSFAFASAAYRTICSACESSGDGSSPVQCLCCFRVRQACHHCFELVIIVFCFICTAGSFMLLNSDVLRKERDEVPPALWEKGVWEVIAAVSIAGRCTAAQTGSGGCVNIADRPSCRAALLPGGAGYDTLPDAPLPDNGRRGDSDDQEAAREVAQRQHRRLCERGLKRLCAARRATSG